MPPCALRWQNWKGFLNGRDWARGCLVLPSCAVFCDSALVASQVVRHPAPGEAAAFGQRRGARAGARRAGRHRATRHPVRAADALTLVTRSLRES